MHETPHAGALTEEEMKAKHDALVNAGMVEGQLKWDDKMDQIKSKVVEAQVEASQLDSESEASTVI